MPMSIDEQLSLLTRGVVDLVSVEDLRRRLENSEKTGRPLKVKAGFDPTRPDLHLGHSVLMAKMRQFQDAGHEVIFVVGDFTASIGDPSGRNKTRPPLTREQILAGAKTYADQAFKILDRAKTHTVYNSEWLGAMKFDDVVRLAGKYTLARMMERQDFKQRWEDNNSISIHELLYPLAQAYDSVHLQCDIELGGTDQLFNLMVGRDLMREWGLTPQLVMTTPLLEGISARVEAGVVVGDKMSKSLDNYVGVDEAPEEQFGKLMSIADGVMWRYYELLSREPMSAIVERKNACESGAMNPKLAKVELAKEIVSRFHSSDEAERVHAAWEKQFSQKQIPDEMPQFEVESADPVRLTKLLITAELATSNKDGERKIAQGSIDINGAREHDIRATLGPGEYVIRSGRHYARVRVLEPV